MHEVLVVGGGGTVTETLDEILFDLCVRVKVDLHFSDDVLEIGEEVCFDALLVHVMGHLQCM